MSRLKGGRGERRNRDGAGEAIPPTRKRGPRPPVPPDAGQYLNRELNVLAFFRRVLEEAQDERRLRGDGTYERVKPAPAEVPLDSQQWLIDHRAQGVVIQG